MIDEWTRQGGAVIYAILAVGGLAIPGSLVGLLLGAINRRAGRTALISLILIGTGLAVLGLGGGGWLLERHRMEEALVEISDPADRATVLAAGTAEARTPLAAGLALGLFPLVAGLGLSGLGIVRLARFERSLAP
jgi:hypothetical protein